MVLAAGARFGAYEILSAIGAGGMGEVYRARDTKLNRDVALKILPELFAADPDRLARFQREAHVLALLNHPNIAIIHGLEESNGIRALVLELVEGPTLADRITQGPAPLTEALTIARQIADAVEAAHAKGITHRDLKPANIKIAPNDVVKVLDFGLAKAATPDGAGPDPSQAPTVSVGGTRDGIILGTAAYMSPEQARGKPVDKRTDIWAFGCVLYEMLAGRAAFHGETISDTIAAILGREPDWGALPAATPPGIRRLLRRCLEKDPRRRLHDVADARIEIDDLLAGVSEASATPLAERSPVGLLGGMVGAMLLISAVFAGWWYGVRPPSAPARSVQLQRLTDFVGIEESPAFSPDGKTVAFVAQVGGQRHIWIRLLAGGAPLQLTRDAAAHEQPRWAPDSSALIYDSPSETPGEEGTIWEIAALGGTPRRIVTAPGGGDISHDGRRIAIFQYQRDHIDLVAAARDGSGAVRISQLSGDYLYRYPRWSPDDRSVAFLRSSSTDFDARLYIVPTAGGEPKEIARSDDVRGLSWLSDGSGLVYSSSRGSTVLYPPAFNLRLVGRDGTDDHQLTFGDGSYVEPDVQGTGRIVASRIRTQSDIWKFPFGGSPGENTRGAVRITHQTGVAQTPSVGPDGRELVYLSDSGGHGNLWVGATDGSSVRQITFERDPGLTIGVPVWAPAGNRIAFIATRMGNTGLLLINPDGSGLRQAIVRGSWANWSGDGRWLYYSPGREGPLCIEKVPVDGGSPVSVRCDNAGGPAVASDGSTLYFVAALKSIGGPGDWEIRRARPETGPFEVLARIAAARVPVASLFMHIFLSPDGRWLALPLTDGTTSNIWILPTAGGPLRPITDFGQRPVVIARRVSWAPDGKSIYAAVADTDADVVLLDGLLP